MESIEKVINSGLEKVMSAKDWPANNKLEFIRAVTILLERMNNSGQPTGQPHVATKQQKTSQPFTPGSVPLSANPGINPFPEELMRKITTTVNTSNPYGDAGLVNGERTVKNGIEYVKTDDGKCFMTTDKIGNQLPKPVEVNPSTYAQI